MGPRRHRLRILKLKLINISLERVRPPPERAAVLADATPFERNDDVSLGALLGVLAPFIFAAAVFGGFYRLFKLFSSEF